MKLYLLHDYTNAQVSWTKGQSIDVDERYAAFLMVDAPGTFATEIDDDHPLVKGKPKKAANKAIVEAVEEKDV